MPPFSGVASTLLATHRGSARRSDHYRSWCVAPDQPRTAFCCHAMNLARAPLCSSFLPCGADKRSPSSNPSSVGLGTQRERVRVAVRGTHGSERKPSISNISGVSFSGATAIDAMTTYITRSSWSSSSSIYPHRQQCCPPAGTLDNRRMLPPEVEQAGVPCARHQKFVSLDEITLRLPWILRVDGLNRGQAWPSPAADAVQRPSCRYAARSTGERRSPSFERLLGRILQSSSSTSATRAGFTTSDSVRGRQPARTSAPHVERAMARESLLGCSHAASGTRASRVHRPWRGRSRPLVLSAGQVSGSEVTAIDYSHLPDGRPVFWEANRHFRMAGDPGPTIILRHQCVPGRREFEARATDARLAEALLALVHDRFGRESAPPPVDPERPPGDLQCR